MLTIGRLASLCSKQTEALYKRELSVVASPATEKRSENGETKPNAILITGGLGQIGTELTRRLRQIYGRDNVIVSDVIKPSIEFRREGPFVFADVQSSERMEEIVVESGIDWLIHLPSILSAKGELNPEKAWDINIEGTRHAFALANKHALRLFIPSSIAVFGPSTPLEFTPNTCPMDPMTMYGITKRTMELLGSYYRKKYNLDFRSIRYPGIISHETPPGGGTTDYAVDIFYKALRQGKYESYLNADSRLPMMLMEDCLDATVEFLQAPPSQLAEPIYNLSAVSFTPAELGKSIRRHIPGFEMTYAPDFRQGIADGWPRILDDSTFRRDIPWTPKYGTVDSLVDYMFVHLKKKLAIE